jgi:O-antigen ligase
MVRWRNAFTIPALLFLLAGAISVVDAPDRRAALGLYRAYIVEPIAFAIVVATVCGSARRAYLVLGGLLLGAIWVGVPNGVVVLAAIRDHSYHVTDTPPVIFYQTQNAVALFMEPLVAAAAAVLLYARDPRIRLFSLLALCVLLPVEVLTFSRGGYLAVAAVAVALAVSHRRRLWLSPGLVAAGLLLSRLPLVANRIALETHNVYGNTVFFRFEIWSATGKLLRQRPLAGAGLSGFQQRIAPFWNSTHPLPSQRFNDPHNIVLNFWVETGLLGLLAFTWIFLALLAAGWRGWRKDTRKPGNGARRSSCLLKWRTLQPNDTSEHGVLLSCTLPSAKKEKRSTSSSALFANAAIPSLLSSKSVRSLIPCVAINVSRLWLQKLLAPKKNENKAADDSELA